jgi:transaldolase
MRQNPLLQLRALGQSVWLDDLDRGLLDSGALARLVRADGVSGVTTNPAIFGKALASRGHAARIASLAAAGTSAPAAYESLVTDDVRAAADVLLPAWRGSGGADGFVSIEVPPTLAHDAGGTITAAWRLWRLVDRPNVMIKVPGTAAGLRAVRTLLADGVNVNVTLLFDARRYARFADAFQSALEARAAAGQGVDTVHSVASFFLSRIDTLVDARLGALGTPRAQALRGQAAIAAARLAHAHYREWSRGARWRRLARLGARPQRLLWASTSAKDPAYPDLKYVEPLIGRGTVTTLPRATLEAYRDHGRPAPRLARGRAAARALVPLLGELGIDLHGIGRALEHDGLRKFIEPWAQAHRMLEARLRMERVA